MTSSTNYLLKATTSNTSLRWQPAELRRPQTFGSEYAKCAFLIKCQMAKVSSHYLAEVEYLHPRKKCLAYKDDFWNANRVLFITAKTYDLVFLLIAIVVCGGITVVSQAESQLLTLGFMVHIVIWKYTLFSEDQWRATDVWSSCACRVVLVCKSLIFHPLHKTDWNEDFALRLAMLVVAHESVLFET